MQGAIPSRLCDPDLVSFDVLAFICAIALIGPALAAQRDLRVPVVVGELLVGIAVGRTGLGLLDAEDGTFTFLAEVGFALVMVVAGSHVPVRDPQLRARARVGLLRAAAIGVLSVPAGFAIASAFGTGHGPLYAVVLASSSAALILPVVQTAGELDDASLALLPQVAVADAAAIVALPMAIDPGEATRALAGGLLVVLVAAVVLAVLLWAERSGRRRRLHAFSEERRLAIELRTSLALVFALAAVATATHVTVMLAGFAYGLILAALGEPRRLGKQLFALTEGLFAPLFFVWLGASLDLRTLGERPSSILLGLTLGVTALAVHGAMVLTRQEPLTAVLSAAQLGVPVAAVTIGRSLDVVTVEESAALLLSAVLTLVATTFIGRRMASRRASLP